MPHTDPLSQFYTLFTVGVGLLLVGCSNALVGTGSRWRTLTIVAFASLVCVGLASLLTEQLVPWFAGVGFVCVGCAYVSNLAAVRSLVSNSTIRSVCIASVGLCLLLGSGWHYDAQKQSLNDESNQLFQLQFNRSPGVEDTSVHAVTDAGTPLHLMKSLEERTPADSALAERQYLSAMYQKETIIRRQPATDVSNCHGWVFTGGRYSLAKEDVERILTDNHYTTTKQAQVHDLVIYRDGNQSVTHTAMICAVLVDGTILVEGKWGRLGVYIHDVHGSCYGDNFHYYHSPRVGHIVRGLSPVPQSSLTSSQREPDIKH